MVENLANYFVEFYFERNILQTEAKHIKAGPENGIDKMSKFKSENIRYEYCIPFIVKLDVVTDYHSINGTI